MLNTFSKFLPCWSEKWKEAQVPLNNTSSYAPQYHFPKCWLYKQAQTLPLKTEENNTKERDGPSPRQWILLNNTLETFHCFPGTELHPSNDAATVHPLRASRTRIMTSFTALAGLSGEEKSCQVLDKQMFPFF